MQYSNIGAGLAIYLVGLATSDNDDMSSMLLVDYTNTEIFQLLGMEATSFRRSDLTKVATPYTKEYNIWDPEVYMEMPIYDSATFPDGGLRSSANDMAKFLGAIMNEGKLTLETTKKPSDEEADAVTTSARVASLDSIVLLQPETVQDMLRPRYDSGHSIFWYVTTFSVGGQNRTMVGYNGGDPGAFSFMFFDPDTKTGFFMAANGEGGTLDPVAFANLTAALIAYADELAQQHVGDNHSSSLDSPSADPESDSSEGPASNAIVKAVSTTIVFLMAVVAAIF